MGRLHWEQCPTPLYSEQDIAYQQAYSGPYEDCSLYGDEGALIAARKDGAVTGYGRPVMLFGKLRENAVKAHLDLLLQDRFLYCDYVMGGGLSTITPYLLRHGYIARPYYVQMLDLTQAPSALHAGLRKSYANLVNRSSGECWDGRAFQRLRDYHFIQHGQTRSDETWAIQFEMLGNCAVCAADDNAAAMMYYNQKHAYYACGASRPDGTSHAVLWRLILRCQELGIEQLEMGEQVWQGDPKQVNIASFKRGFGGMTKLRLLIGKNND